MNVMNNRSFCLWNTTVHRLSPETLGKKYLSKTGRFRTRVQSLTVLNFEISLKTRKSTALDGYVERAESLKYIFAFRWYRNQFYNRTRSTFTIATTFLWSDLTFRAPSVRCMPSKELNLCNVCFQMISKSTLQSYTKYFVIVARAFLWSVLTSRASSVRHTTFANSVYEQVVMAMMISMSSEKQVP